MFVEIDQSGKIGKTNEDTVIAFADGETHSVLIPRKAKQECLRQLRRRGYRPEVLYIQLFTVALYFLLCNHLDRIELALIDTEYPGQNERVLTHLHNLVNRAGLKLRRHQIAFGYVGKRSAAHLAALETFRGNRRPDRILSVDELLREFR